MDNVSNEKIKVLVVDDSTLMSRQIAGILDQDAKIEVVGRAKDGLEAISMVGDLKPDVVTMDVEMPRMNGITALKHIMVKHATPTVMISALTTEGARTTFDALKYGAIDVIAKPSRREDESLDAQKADIIAKVRRAAAIRTGRSRYLRMLHAQDTKAKTSQRGVPDSTTRFIGIGAGTGGYYGLLRIVPALGDDFQDVLIVIIQVASRYVPPFVDYLDMHSVIPVRGVHEGVGPEKGCCYIGSGQDGLLIDQDPDGCFWFTKSSSREDNPAPSGIDLMFGSLAGLRDRAVGVIMTGSGADGAAGIVEIRKAGGIGVVQDINNCLDPQMPLAVLQRDMVEKILPDYLMAEFIMKLGGSGKLN